MKSTLTVTDQFCGAGGSSIGAVAAGAELRLALNHWQLAIDTHNANFPNADHECTNVRECDPRRYPSTDILITSPECTNHSIAKGKKRNPQADLFGNGAPDPAEERSRATMWDVPRFAEVHKYRVIIVENVVDARRWVNFNSWLLAMHEQGYEHKCVYFNSMFAHPVPQSRDRMYVVFWRKGHPAPNLDFRPKAWCRRCEKDVESVQAWKPGRSWGKYNQQYVYACPHCATVLQPYYYCAANAIDWSLPIQRIGDREKPLKDKTMARIRAGIAKFAAPVVVDTTFDGMGRRVTSLSEALRTQTSRQSSGIAVPPFLMDRIHSGNDRDMVWRVDGPDRTQIGQNTKALVVPPYILALRGGLRPEHLGEALSTVVGSGVVHALVAPPIQITLRGENAPKTVEDPIGTVSAGGIHHALLVPYYKSGNASDITDPVPTVTTVERHALVLQTEAMLAVEDWHFRMLGIGEITDAMGIPRDYELRGGKREQVKLLGNAVTPPVMEMLMRPVVATFD